MEVRGQYGLVDVQRLAGGVQQQLHGGVYVTSLGNPSWLRSGYAGVRYRSRPHSSRTATLPFYPYCSCSPTLTFNLSIFNFQLSNAIHSFIYCKEDVPSAGTALHQVLDAVGLGACHQRRSAAAVQLL